MAWIAVSEKHPEDGQWAVLIDVHTIINASSDDIPYPVVGRLISVRIDSHKMWKVKKELWSIGTFSHWSPIPQWPKYCKKLIEGRFED